MKIVSVTTLAFTIGLASLVGQAAGADEKFDAAARRRQSPPGSTSRPLPSPMSICGECQSKRRPTKSPRLMLVPAEEIAR